MRTRAVVVLAALQAVAWALAPAALAGDLTPAQREQAAARRPRLDAALERAGANRPQLERVLDHYRAANDEQALDSAEFLIANMEGQGYALMGLYDEKGNEIPFDIADHPDFAAATKALDALEKQHGSLDFKKKRFDHDLEVVTADYLIANIDDALRTWRESPWARTVAYETFREFVLPYRSTNEPLDTFRPACREAARDALRSLKDPTSLREAADAVGAVAGAWAGFKEIYYLHPTDQGFSEIRASKAGRCEDLANLTIYARRACAIPIAQDYTPWWAHSDNNHAWEVLLDGNGKVLTPVGLHGKAAKVYRKTYSRQESSLGARTREGESAPPWLNRTTQIDVTPQYGPVSDVTVAITPREHERFVYLCVFNGGEWKPIAWADASPRVTFRDMGRDIAYLPACWIDGKVVPAAEPLILEKDGRVRVLDGTGAAPVSVAITTLAEAVPHPDLPVDKPRITVESGKTYELFVWRDGAWASLGTRVGGETPITFENVPGGRLYWMKPSDSRNLERIFTIEGGKQRIW